MSSNEEREVSNLKKFSFMKEREDYENRFMGDRKGLFRIHEVRMYIIYQSGDAK